MRLSDEHIFFPLLSAEQLIYDTDFCFFVVVALQIV